MFFSQTNIKMNARKKTNFWLLCTSSSMCSYWYYNSLLCIFTSSSLKMLSTTSSQACFTVSWCFCLLRTYGMWMVCQRRKHYIHNNIHFLCKDRQNLKVPLSYRKYYRSLSLSQQLVIVVNNTIHVLKLQEWYPFMSWGQYRLPWLRRSTI